MFDIMSMQRSLNTFPIHRTLLAKLSSAGFTCVSDVIDYKACELSRDINVTPDEALSLIQLLKDSSKKEGRLSIYGRRSKSVLEILQQEKLNIVTFSEKLDDLFDGGIQLGKVTEICGCPGIGKTQLCFQLVVDVQIPKCCGGVCGEAIYIDTEGSFVAERVYEIAQATVLHCHSLFIGENHSEINKVPDMMNGFNVEGILSRIHYFRCFDYVQLIALMHTLEEFLKSNGKIKLIVLDSIAHVFRQDFDDFSLRNRLLSMVSQTFNKFCADFHLAVMMTNHMTTKFDKNQKPYLIPALGETWGHSCTYRVILHWINHARHALLYKSPSKKELSAAFQITVAGIRDIVK